MLLRHQLGNLVGCVSGLSPKTTGIIIIAMGTSLPDTIASRTAALQDDTADAAIGNITGSNRSKRQAGTHFAVLQLMKRVFGLIRLT